MKMKSVLWSGGGQALRFEGFVDGVSEWLAGSAEDWMVLTEILLPV